MAELETARQQITELEDKNNKLQEEYQEQYALLEEASKVENALNYAEAFIKDLETEIANYKNKIAQLQKEISETRNLVK